MTLVVAWLEPENDLVWCFADSRFVGQGGGSLTDSAPKILPIDIGCSRADGVPAPPFLKLQLGYAFAGSALPALSCHGFASACLLNLMSSGPPAAPLDLRWVHDWIARIAETYVRDIMATFEYLLFGFCPAEGRLRAFHFRAQLIQQNLEITSSEKRLTDRWGVLSIGSGAGDFDSRFARLVNQGPPYPGSFRLPRVVVADMIRDPARQDVGGDVQIAYVNRIGLHRLQSVVPFGPGLPFPRMTFLGQDTNNLGQVGPFFVGMPGLA